MKNKGDRNSLAIFALGVIAFAAMVTASLWITESRMRNLEHSRVASESITAYGLIIAFDRLLEAAGSHAGNPEAGFGVTVTAFQTFRSAVDYLGAPERLEQAIERGYQGDLATLQDFVQRYDAALRGAINLAPSAMLAETQALRESVFETAKGLHAGARHHARLRAEELERFGERVFLIALAFAVFGGAVIGSAMRRTRILQARQRALEASEAKLRELSCYRRQFLANMSHELRTPLNAISGFSEAILLQKDVMPRESMVEYVGLVHDSAQDLKRLTDDALDLSKIDAGKFDLNMEEAYVPQLFEDVVKQFRGAAEQRGLILRSDAPQRLGLICDRMALKRCISNVLSNAVKFSDDGDAIDLLGYPRGDDIFVIEVKDRGCGIPANELQGIWMVYARSSLTRKSDREGAGLGLAITKAIIDGHGGFVEVQSKVGVGTSVRLCLPSDLLFFMDPPTEGRVAPAAKRRRNAV